MCLPLLLTIQAITQEHAHNGMLFMKEMIELSKAQATEPASDPHVLQLLSDPYYGAPVYAACPAQFGYELATNPGVTGQVGNQRQSLRHLYPSPLISFNNNVFS